MLMDTSDITTRNIRYLVTKKTYGTIRPLRKKLEVMILQTRLDTFVGYAKGLFLYEGVS